MLERKLLAHALARGIDELTVNQTVWARKVDELERTTRSSGRRAGRVLLGMHTVRADREQLAGLYLSNQLGTNGVQRTALRRDSPAVWQTPQDQRPNPPRVAR